MSEILDTLRGMERMQYALLFAFLTCYALCLGGLFDGAGRLRAAGLALLSASGFVFFTDPWYHGVLLIAAAVASMGVFVLAVWMINAALVRTGNGAAWAAEPALHEEAPTAPRDETRPRGDGGATVAPG